MSKKWSNETSLMFSEHRTFEGRNGWYKAIGVNIFSNTMTTRIHPITSKNKIASCTVEIPTQDLDKFIEELKKTKFTEDDRT